MRPHIGRFTGARAAIVVGAWLMVFCVAADAGLSGLSRTPVLGWLPKMVAGTGYLDDNRSRVEAAIQWVGDHGAPRPRVLAVVGISNVREGIAVTHLSGQIGSDWKVLGLGGAGLGMTEVGRHARLVLESALIPDTVIIGTSLPQFLDAKPRPPGARPGLFEHLRRGDFRNAAVAVRDSSWAYSRRQDVSLAVSGATAHMRSTLFRWFHVSLPPPVGASPWRDMIYSDWPDHFSAETLKEEEQFFENLGAFSEDNYRNARRAPGEFSTIVKEFRRRGTRVIVLLMPEHSVLRRRIPAAATEWLKTEWPRAFEDPPPLIDLRAALTDDYFVDLAHLNARGREALTPVLADAIRPLIR